MNTVAVFIVDGFPDSMYNAYNTLSLYGGSSCDWFSDALN